MKPVRLIVFLIIIAGIYGAYRVSSKPQENGMTLTHNHNTKSTQLSDEEIRSVLIVSYKLVLACKFDEAILLLQPLAEENAYRLIDMKPEHVKDDSIASDLGVSLYFRGDKDAAMPYLRFIVDRFPPGTDSVLVGIVHGYKPSTSAAPQPSARINGKPVDGVVYAKEMIFVPADTADRLLGADMTDDPDGGWIVSRGKDRVRLSTDAVLDGMGAKGIVPARRSGPRIVMVSLWPLAQQLGATTTWDPRKRMLDVKIPKTQPLTVDKARQLLRQSFDLREQGKYEESINSLEKVVAFDPKLEADFPDESVHLQAAGELAMTYFTHKDWAKAIPLFEQSERYTRERYPNADTIAPTMIAECRKRLKAEENSK